jgi:cell division protein FtsZ
MLRTSYGRSPVKIKAVGIGGGGCNAVNRMILEQISNVEFVAMNTDTQHLAITEAPQRIVLGERLTHGSGAGGDHNIGLKCAEDSLDEIKQALAGSDMVFLAAGMGGGTGTGAIPLIAEAASF